MKAFVALLVLLSVACVALGISEPVITQQLIKTVNTHPLRTWRAGHNQFSDWSVDEVKRILGTKLETMLPVDDGSYVKERVRNNGIPDHFDSREEFPGCVHPIRDQARCGSCWAFGATEALSDRFCIASNGTISVVLSPQDMVSCDHLNLGCNGGQLLTAWFYLKHSGVVAEECFPYASQEGKAPKCPSTCVDGATPFKSRKYKVSKYYKVSSTFVTKHREEDIQKEIMAHGPVEAAFHVYNDFMSYTGGVYQHVTGSFLGGHAIKIVGWGVDNSTGSAVPYWLIANSWGEKWGEKGFFRILRGSNECGIEATVYAGIPDVEHAPRD